MLALIFFVLSGPAGGPPAGAFAADPPALAVVKRPAWRTDYDQARAESVATGKTLVVLFTDPIGCLPCRKLESGALSDPAVRDELARCVCCRIDTRTDYGKFMLVHFARHNDAVPAWPTIKVYKGDGRRVADWRPTGDDVPADILLKLIR